MKNLFIGCILSLLIFSCGKESPVVSDPVISFTLTVNPGNGGTVSSNGGTYNEGQSVSITATPNSEYIFQNWSNGSTDNPLMVTVNQNITLTANFIKRKYPLTINIQGEGTVREEIVSSGKSTPTEYNSGTVVRLTADPTGDWVFEEWTGSVTETNQEITITLDEPKTVNVRFMRYFDYNQPSYILRHTPLWIDHYSIPKQNNINTIQDGYLKWYDALATIADFNDDGYYDVLFGVNGNDLVETRLPLELYLNQGDNEIFIYDNSLIDNNIGCISGRKSIIGDFNLDGKPDVFFADHGIHENFPGGIPSILLSNESGYNFQLIDLPRGFYHTTTSGDIDNDGDLDIYIPAMANQNSVSSYSFLINDGTGNFEINDNLTNDNFGRTSSELYDLNKDGYLDLITGDENVKIFFGDGNDFISSSYVEITGESGWEIYDFAFYDLDIDGNDDLIVSFHDNTGYMIRIYRQNTDNTFNDKTNDFIENNIGENHSIVWIRVQDIDNNGRVDLIENDKGHFNSEEYSWPNVSGNIPVRWEWNGSRFITINP